MKSMFLILAGLAGIFHLLRIPALVVAPTDQMQGDIYRIIYYHVPCVDGLHSFYGESCRFDHFLIWRNPKADMHALIGAEMGVVFLSVNLTTGPIWARPVWGIWWIGTGG
jgi:heme exporter protein C